MYLYASDKREIVIPLRTLQYSAMHVCLVLLFQILLIYLL